MSTTLAESLPEQPSSSPPKDTLVGTLGVVTPMRLSTESHRTKDRQNLLHKLFPVPGPECFGRRTLGFLI